MVHHHIKYKEIHGVDEVVLMSMRDHVNLHQRLRKTGKCNIPAPELQKISFRACTRRKGLKTLKIEASTRDELKSLSTNMEDTFDTIICRLISEHHELEELKKKK